MKKTNCDMCLMPFEKDKGQSDNESYCSLCHQNGELSYKGDSLKEFKKISYEGMRKNNVGKLKAKLFTWTIGFAPYWKDKK